MARADVLASAQNYLREAGEPVPVFGQSFWLLAGHHPDLFHPGVWLKNSCLYRSAIRNSAVALNLIVDNDTVKSTAITVPRWDGDLLDPETVRVDSIPFDRYDGGTPFESRTVLDEDCFDQVSQRAVEITRNWGCSPLLPAFWAEVRRQRGRTDLIGERFVAARRSFERRWDVHNLELPVSWLCRTNSFACFVAAILTDLRRYRTIYNDCVKNYRRECRIRSRNHPVPDLAADGDWLEAPFWANRKGDPRRRRLFARPAEGRIELRAGTDRWPDLDLADTSKSWPEREDAGFRIRPRALTTTMFARLCLADLFIHGIGGAKYDEVTEAIAEKFFGIPLAPIVVVTGTLRLPLPPIPDRQEELAALKRELRDLIWNPQRHLSQGADAAIRQFIEYKQWMIDQKPPNRAGRRERYRVLRTITEALRGHVQAQMGELAARRATLSREIEAREIIRRRDYAFVLYPEDMLREFLVPAADASAMHR